MLHEPPPRWLNRLSIRTVLGLLLGAMGLLLTGESAAGWLQARHQYLAAARVAELGGLDLQLYAVLSAQRKSSATTLAALVAPTAIDAAGDVRIGENRRALDGALDQALRSESRFPTELAASIARMRAAHAAVVAQRPRVDAALHLPLAERDPQTLVITSQNLQNWLDALADTIAGLDAGMALFDPVVDALLAVRQAASDMRVGVGNQIVRVNVAVAAGRAWTNAEIAADRDDRVVRELAWATLSAAASRPETPRALADAIAGVRTGYLAYAQSVLDPIVATLTDGHPADVNLRDIERRSSAAAQTLVDTVEAAVRAVQERTGQLQHRDLRNLVVNGGVLLLALAGSLGGLLLAERRISVPIRRLAIAMHRLAQRDTTVLIPGLQRHDEVGAMARAVLVFRDGIERAEALEKLAALNEAARLQQENAAKEQVGALAAAQGDVVETMVYGLVQLSDGNLCLTLDLPLAAEYEMLRDLFNQAVASLRQTVSDVSHCTEAISGGTQELAGAADDLAQRTQLQAASIAQAAAALGDITATIGHTAASSRQAQSVAEGAAGEAETSAAVVSETVAAMREIDVSARSIAQVIGLIDEIALQTNLLALNAAIEAASAGEAGRGFALVAQEVRELAQRAAVAARQIKRLVGNSIGHATTGVALVDATGQALDRIRSGLRDITAAVNQIAEAAQEQATAIAEVHTTVNQMDEVTQQNAAMVEQSTAAVHALAQETAELSRDMERFKIAEAA